tara:strand:+ start:314 stop:676 length:363 start_codon:yes stop_codon:yes gene_type:complete
MLDFFKQFLFRSNRSAAEFEEIIRQYGNLLAQGVVPPRSTSDLPFGKDTIHDALVQSLKMELDSATRNALEVGLVCLADFQDVRECSARGVDMLTAVGQEAETFLREAQFFRPKQDQLHA